MFMIKITNKKQQNRERLFPTAAQNVISKAWEKDRKLANRKADSYLFKNALYYKQNLPYYMLSIYLAIQIYVGSNVFQSEHNSALKIFSSSKIWQHITQPIQRIFT